MTPDLTFSEAIATLPEMVRYWIMWMNVTVLAALVTFAAHRVAWRDAMVLLLANVPMVATMMWLYGQVGFVRLLGAPHLIFWTPLVIYFVIRMRSGGLPRPVMTAMLILTVTLSVSLVLDAADVARWVAGDRAPM